MESGSEDGLEEKECREGCGVGVGVGGHSPAAHHWASEQKSDREGSRSGGGEGKPRPGWSGWMRRCPSAIAPSGAHKARQMACLRSATLEMFRKRMRHTRGSERLYQRAIAAVDVLTRSLIVYAVVSATSVRGTIGLGRGE
ncbi:hypothetical protein K458DRAFT_89659 [Lentithecium fluviatile CBS 122367]|uniref:Uncharacterized protein n=1 Tax=Lentithecium fluviatile CBS 122367 TaxID=1168545 RepID=A0A6G1ISJ6_9PLEO|nr:hypothetical protein K458DRAFT_89659 [Lentithecium fluviatile CBS 122367]